MTPVREQSDDIAQPLKNKSANRQKNVSAIAYVCADPRSWCRACRKAVTVRRDGTDSLQSCGHR